MSTRRPRSSVNSSDMPPKKKARLMTNQAVASLSRNVSRKINLSNGEYNFGTITKLNNRRLGVRLSRKLLNEFMKIYKKSYDNEIEYAGSTKFTVNNTRGYVKFNTPTRVTNKNFKEVTPLLSDLESYIVYHTHPIPRDGSIYVTLPSDKDFTAYIQFYPYVQANIILEKHGYYVIDLLESDQFNKPDPTEVYKFFIDKVYMKMKFENVATVYKGIQFFKATPESLQRVINNYTDPLMRQKFGMSIRYHRYTELAEITLFDRERMMLP